MIISGHFIHCEVEVCGTNSHLNVNETGKKFLGVERCKPSNCLRLELRPINDIEISLFLYLNPLKALILFA